MGENRLPLIYRIKLTPYFPECVCENGKCEIQSQPYACFKGPNFYFFNCFLKQSLESMEIAFLNYSLCT